LIVRECVFDIETAALPDAEIPPTLIRNEMKKVQASEDPEAWRAFLGLYAPAATVVCIGMLDPRTRRGEVLYDDRHGAIDRLEGTEGYEIGLRGGDESRILQEFWRAVSAFDRVITFNGRGFDVPFLMQRSLIRNVPVTRDLMPDRYRKGTSHLDLMDVLSQFRATRPYGLAVWTEAIGEASPKEGPVTGASVGEAFAAGKAREIAEYCLRDVIATAALAERVLDLWGPTVGNPAVDGTASEGSNVAD
jgi:hypothetical protein